MTETQGNQPAPEDGESEVRQRAERRMIPGATPVGDSLPRRHEQRNQAAPEVAGGDASIRARAARRTFLPGAAPPGVRAPENGTAPAPAPVRTAGREPGGEPRPERDTEARPRLLDARVLALLLLSLLTVAALTVSAYRAGRQAETTEVEVPVVRGDDLSTANNVLQELGLRTVLTPPVFDDQIARNAVVSTDPPAGTVVGTGEVVTLTYSNGAEPITVPPLVGQPEEAARSSLNQVGLTAGQRVQEPSAEVPSGSILRLEPDVGTEVESGRPITLVVSSGPPPVVLPRVIGLTEAEATQQLEDAGVEVRVELDDSQTVETGRVIDQTPAPGTVADPGATIVLRVSTGP